MRTGTLGMVGVALLALLALPADARGQRTRPEGVWVGFGVGGGLSTSSEFSTLSQRWGGSFYARVGGTLSQRALLGAEFIAWGRKRDGLNPARGNLSLVALWYPAQTGPLFLKGGAGLAVASPLRASPAGGMTTHGTQGLGLGGGGGAHLRLGRSVFLTPNLDLLFQYFPAGQDPSLSNFVVLATIGVTFH